ncbi:hypothetical protein E2542_SST23158 [Spatholobus suberectus]|nr:hypothetical protein E2542_SST23158 [Spatholobus suberectus]
MSSLPNASVKDKNFLIFIIIVILIVYYTVFKPQDPKIDAGRTKYMAATFSFQSFPLSAPAILGPTFANGDGVGFNYGLRVEPTLEIESKLIMAGRVRVLHFFTRHVYAKTTNACNRKKEEEEKSLHFEFNHEREDTPLLN